MIKPVFIELKKPSGGHPGHVVEGFYSLDGNTVILVDRFGDPVTDTDGKTYRRKKPESGLHPLPSRSAVPSLEL